MLLCKTMLALKKLACSATLFYMMSRSCDLSHTIEKRHIYRVSYKSQFYTFPPSPLLLLSDFPLFYRLPPHHVFRKQFPLIPAERQGEGKNDFS